MATLPEDLKPYIIALSVRAILYGVYFVTLIHCLRWLILDGDRWWKLRKHIDQRLLIITIVIFSFLTTSLGIAFRITIDLLRGDNNSARLTILKIYVENNVILTANAVLIYRCWVIFAKTHRSVIISLPLVLWLTGLACSVFIVYNYTMFLYAHPDVYLIFSRLVPSSRLCWIIFYLCDIAISIYTTCGIIYRISRIPAPYGSKKNCSRQLCTTSKILAKFGSLYTITSVLSLVSLILDLEPTFDLMRFMLDAINFTMPGITFNLIQIGVHKERAGGGGGKERHAVTPSFTSTFDQTPITQY